MRPNGIGIFYQNFESKSQEDPQLMAGFFNAIQCFAQEFVKERLDVIVSGEHQFYFVKRQEFTIIVKVVKNFNLNKIRDKIDSLGKMFYERFEEKILRVGTDPTAFNGFEKTVRDVFKINIKTTHKSSELLEDFLGISSKKINFKKVINSL